MSEVDGDNSRFCFEHTSMLLSSLVTCTGGLTLCSPEFNSSFFLAGILGARCQNFVHVSLSLSFFLSSILS